MTSAASGGGPRRPIVSLRQACKAFRCAPRPARSALLGLGVARALHVLMSRPADVTAPEALVLHGVPKGPRRPVLCLTAVQAPRAPGRAPMPAPALRALPGDRNTGAAAGHRSNDNADRARRKAEGADLGRTLPGEDHAPTVDDQRSTDQIIDQRIEPPGPHDARRAPRGLCGRHVRATGGDRRVSGHRERRSGTRGFQEVASALSSSRAACAAESK